MFKCIEVAHGGRIIKLECGGRRRHMALFLENRQSCMVNMKINTDVINGCR